MKALVKPDHEPYEQMIPENSWGDWIRNRLDWYLSKGWTIIEDYNPPEE